MTKVMITGLTFEHQNNSCSYLANEKGLTLIMASLDGKLIKTYLEIKPDVLILNLDLNSLRGLDIIKTLSLIPTEKNKCNIIVTTSEPNYKIAIENTTKIHNILVKPFSNKCLVSNIREITTKIKRTELKSQRLDSLLLKLNFNLYSSGTIYLKEMIKICYVNPKSLNNLNKLYDRLGKKHKISSNKIKWRVHSSLATMNRYADRTSLNEIFYLYDSKRNITPKYFITLLIDYLKKV